MVVDTQLFLINHVFMVKVSGEIKISAFIETLMEACLVILDMQIS